MELLLASLVLVPLIASAIGALLPSAKAARAWALAASLFTAVATALLAVQFFTATGPDAGRLGFSHATAQQWGIAAIGFSVNMGVDAISLWLVILTVFLTPLAIASSFGSIKEREKEFYAWMLLLLGAMNGVFVARDALLFYIFFELTLVPMFFIIGIWGGPERRDAAGRFFLFTFAGSVFTLASVIYLALRAKGGGMSFDIDLIVAYAQKYMTSTERTWVVLGLLAGFAVKVPLFPVHTWLPLAHTEAPTAGSVILAGVLLKLGTYGILRLAVPIGLVASAGSARVVVAPALIQGIGVLCIVGILYGALVAWVQRDIKKLVAYSSVSHLGFCILGLVALNIHGMQGSVLYMINHGLSTGAMFLVIGMIYDRFHTRDIDQLSGLARKMPVMATFFILFTLSSIGLPALNGFVSEFLTILGAFTSPYLGIAFGVPAALGIILGAVYMLHMAARVIWGPLKVPAEHADPAQADPPDHGHTAPGHHDIKDLSAREIAVLTPLALAVILLGILPNIILKTIQPPLENIAPTAAHIATSTADDRQPAVASQSAIGNRRSAIASPQSAIGN